MVITPLDSPLLDCYEPNMAGISSTRTVPLLTGQFGEEGVVPATPIRPVKDTVWCQQGEPAELLPPAGDPFLTSEHPIPFVPPAPTTSHPSAEKRRRKKSGGSSSEPGFNDDILQPTTSVLHLDPTSVFRPIDFRWQQGLRRSAKEYVPRDWVDRSSIEAAKFIRKLRKCVTEAKQLDLRARYPDSFDAVNLRKTQPPYLRWEVEARVLAGESIEAIAGKTAVRPGVIACYEEWFFDVRNRLDQQAFITHQVLRCFGVGTEPDVGTMWKHYAYWGGPLVLDMVMVGSCQPHSPRNVDEIRQYLESNRETMLSLKAMLSTFLLPINPETHPKIMNIYMRLHQMKTRVKDCAVVVESYDSVLRKMIETLEARQERIEEIEPLSASIPDAEGDSVTTAA